MTTKKDPQVGDSFFDEIEGATFTIDEIVEDGSEFDGWAVCVDGSDRDPMFYAPDQLGQPYISFD